jgi:hypothetical protein
MESEEGINPILAFPLKKGEGTKPLLHGFEYGAQARHKQFIVHAAGVVVCHGCHVVTDDT